MRFKKSSYLLAITLIAVSCTREKIVLTDFGDDKGVAVASFITQSDNPLNLYLFPSQKVIGGKEDSEFAITDAQVEVLSGDTTLTLSYDPSVSQYTGMPYPGFFRAGKNYLLKVTVPGKGVFTSETALIPEYKTPSVEGTVSSQFFNSLQINYSMDLNWEDQPGIKNYYRLLPVALYVNDSQLTDTMSYPIDSYNIYQYDESKLVNGRIKIHEEITGEYLEISPYRLCGVKIYILNVDEMYFRYHEKAKMLSGFDFFTTPIFLPGNISGGYGVFCSFNGMSEKTFIIP